MKKATGILLVLVIILFFTACEPNYYTFDYNKLVQEVESIELIRYNNPNAKEYLDIKEEKVQPFDFKKMEILQELSEEMLEDALQTVMQMDFFLDGRVMDSPSGLCIRMIYKNGDFEIFAADSEDDSLLYPYAGGFFEDGSVKRFIGAVVGTSCFIDEYFPEHEDYT